MLRVNLWIKGKLVNGSLGTLKAIVYTLRIRPPKLPLYALVEFDEYREKCMYSNVLASKCFTIIPISKSFMKRGMKWYRKKLPLLSLGHAFSIHKAQRLTLHKVKFYFKLKMLCYRCTRVML